MEVPPANVPSELISELQRIPGIPYVRQQSSDRVVHAYGKGLRDLVRIGRCDFGRLPDVVVYPSGEHEVVEIVNAALSANAVLVPFGGGTNIAGSLEAPRSENRPVISVDMGRMNRVLEIDEVSRLVRIQCGALGPEIERQLNPTGWTMGHFPDSFNHSTLGGWIARAHQACNPISMATSRI